MDNVEALCVACGIINEEETNFFASCGNLRRERQSKQPAILVHNVFDVFLRKLDLLILTRCRAEIISYCKHNAELKYS